MTNWVLMVCTLFCIHCCNTRIWDRFYSNLSWIHRCRWKCKARLIRQDCIARYILNTFYIRSRNSLSACLGSFWHENSNVQKCKKRVVNIKLCFLNSIFMFLLFTFLLDSFTSEFSRKNVPDCVLQIEYFFHFCD